MTGLFTALGSLALLLLLVGLVKPRWVLPPRWNPNRLKAAGVYLVALLVFSALLNAVSPAPDPASVAAAQEAAAAIEAQARRDAQANRPADPPPVAVAAQIVAAEPKAEAEARQEEQAKRDADRQREAEAKRIAAEKAEADKRALEAASLPVKRSALVALAKTWGWDCKPPSPIETSAVIDSRHVMIPTEVTFCAHPSNLDSFRIYATATATHLIGYTGDQMDPKHDLTAVADARLTQVAKLLSLEALDKEVRAAVQKQRDYSRDNSCKGLMDCPLYDEERVGNGIKLRQRAKPKVSWEWTFSIETRQGDDLLKAHVAQTPPAVADQAKDPLRVEDIGLLADAQSAPSIGMTEASWRNLDSDLKKISGVYRVSHYTDFDKKKRIVIQHFQGTYANGNSYFTGVSLNIERILRRVAAEAHTAERIELMMDVEAPWDKKVRVTAVTFVAPAPLVKQTDWKDTYPAVGVYVPLGAYAKHGMLKDLPQDFCRVRQEKGELRIYRDFCSKI